MDVNEKLQVYFDELAATFPEKVQNALKKIRDFRSEKNPLPAQKVALQLLALWKYIKAKNLDAKWVWSDELLRAYPAPVRDGIKKITEEFEVLANSPSNPLYTSAKVTSIKPFTLGHSDPRNLNKQVELWNNNTKTVPQAAEDIKRKCLLEIVDYPDLPDTEKFRTFLKTCTVIPGTTNAAPGLSDHGHMNAVDFVVKQNDRTIAGTSTGKMKEKWDDPGWTQMLNTAVKNYLMNNSSKLFSEDHLKNPREPWHYIVNWPPKA